MVLKEKGIHLEAFEIYYSLGNKRTFKAVADKLGITSNTVSGWSRDFNWEDKIDDRNKFLAYKMRRDSADQHDAIINGYQLMTREIIKQGVAKSLKEGELPFEVKSASDYEKLVKLDVLLSGGVTDRTEIKNEELREGERKVVDMIQSNPDTWEALNKGFTDDKEKEVKNESTGKRDN